MIPRFLSFALALCFAIPVVAQDKPASQKIYVTVVTHDTMTQHESDVVRSFDNDANLVRVKKASVFNHYRSSDKLFQLRLAKYFEQDVLPVVMLQHEDGAVVYKASGPSAPTGSALYADMKKFWDLSSQEPETASGGKVESQVDSNCPDGKCPVPYIPRHPQVDVRIDPLPDTAELFGGATPVRDAVSQVVIGIGIIVGLFVLVIMAMLVFITAWIVGKAISYSGKDVKK